VLRAYFVHSVSSAHIRAAYGRRKNRGLQSLRPAGPDSYVSGEGFIPHQNVTFSCGTQSCSAASASEQHYASKSQQRNRRRLGDGLDSRPTRPGGVIIDLQCETGSGHDNPGVDIITGVAG